MVGKGAFELTSVVTEKPPSGVEGIGWHRYVITQGKNTITGHRQGSLKGVTVAVEEILVRLNRRAHLKRRVHLVFQEGLDASSKFRKTLA